MIAKMTRKLMVVLVGVGLCLMGLSPSLLAQKIYTTPAEYEELMGKTIEKFSEAPALKIKVASGELPSVEERLPEDYMVVEPKKIGQYGGTLRTTATSWGVAWDDYGVRYQGLFTLSSDLKVVLPNILKDYALSEDFRVLTFHLRKGMKWSDGAPFTADDLMFWYEDIILNDELTPVKPKGYSPGGELMKMIKVDEYTVELQFAVPYPSVVAYIRWWGTMNRIWAPQHYLKKYHIKYNPKADELAKEEGFDHWYQRFLSLFESTNWNQQQEPLFPTLDPWMLDAVDVAGNKYFVRNPYYWKVDTAGNQLPYIDEQVLMLVETSELVNIKAIAGEVSLSAIEMTLENYPLYKENETKGGYQVRLWPQGTTGVRYAFAFNLLYKDPVLAQIFNDIRFRQAMSLAIDRDELNDTFFFGKGIPRQATITPDTSFYEDWMGKYYAEYDPEKANKLLEEMGLRWDKAHQYRLMSDDRPLAITIEFIQVEGPLKLMELIKEYWEKVGVKVSVKEQERSLFKERRQTRDMMVQVWNFDAVSEFALWCTPANRLLSGGDPFYAYDWGYWFATNGEFGEEPPAEIKEFHKVMADWQLSLPGTEEYMKLGKEMAARNVRALWRIGTVGLPPKPVIVKNGLKNVPQEASYAWDYLFWQAYLGETWFFEK